MISPSIYIYLGSQYHTRAASLSPEFARVKAPDSQIAIKTGQIGTGIPHPITSNHKGI